ncbi:MAG TPA: adenylosuccinate lyase [Actinomycetaceae bacterium]|nr:adenylosuccinate lyase [Actinomycetaceae bacterium]
MPVDLTHLNIPLGPLDGRYRGIVSRLVNHLSEAALNRNRLIIEIEWLIHLTQVGAIPGAPVLSAEEQEYLRAIPEDFGAAEIAELGEIERETRHDVKAVEYFLKKRLDSAPGVIGEHTVLPRVHEIVHIFCTSEDINNLAYAIGIRGALHEVWLPAAGDLILEIEGIARTYASQPMLARTHGQPASPTTLGKEFAVVAMRLNRQFARLNQTEILGKLNGATGTYGAHVAAVPETDWEEASRTFVEGLGFTWHPLTTQIEPHDWQADLFADMAHFNRILHNLATDVWTYISLGYFKQNLGAHGSTGSSTMPHKVNPIRFENAEANLEVSCALLDTLAATLVTSRLQRDLTDSTMQRNIGSAFGHSLLAIDNVTRGLAGLDVDHAAMARDLDDNWEVLGEAIQSAMRAASAAGVEGLGDPYERLKELTRGRRVTGDDLREFVHSLGLPANLEERLAALTPADYVGLAPALVRHING